MAEYNLLLRNVFKDSLLVYILLKTKTVLRLISCYFLLVHGSGGGSLFARPKSDAKKALGLGLIHPWGLALWTSCPIEPAWFRTSC